MKATYKYLKDSQFLEVYPIYVNSGEFTKGNTNTPESDFDEIFWRQEYLDLVPDNEWFLIMDSDEMLFGDLRLFVKAVEILNRQDVKCGVIKEIRANFDENWRPRVIKKESGDMYLHKHDTIFNGRHDKLKNHKWITPIGFLHYNYRSDNPVLVYDQPRRIKDRGYEKWKKGESILLTPRSKKINSLR